MAKKIQSYIKLQIPAGAANPVITSYSIHYTKLYDGFYHGTDHINVIVLETDNPFRTGAHTGPAAPTPGRIRQRCTLLVIINGAEGAFLGAAFALGTALHKEFRIGLVAGTRMHGDTTVC